MTELCNSALDSAFEKSTATGLIEELLRKPGQKLVILSAGQYPLKTAIVGLNEIPYTSKILICTFFTC